MSVDYEWAVDGRIARVLRDGGVLHDLRLPPSRPEAGSRVEMRQDSADWVLPSPSSPVRCDADDARHGPVRSSADVHRHFAAGDVRSDARRAAAQASRSAAEERRRRDAAAAEFRQDASAAGALPPVRSSAEFRRRIAAGLAG
jgi:hypothetical protein